MRQCKIRVDPGVYFTDLSQEKRLKRFRNTHRIASSMASNFSSCNGPPPSAQPPNPMIPPYPSYVPPGGTYHTWDLGLSSNRGAHVSSPNAYPTQIPGLWQHSVPPPNLFTPSTSTPQGSFTSQPLGNITTSSSVNTVTQVGPTTGSKRKRATAGSSNSAAKRRNIAASSSRRTDENQTVTVALPAVPAIPGAGPQTVPGMAPGPLLPASSHAYMSADAPSTPLSAAPVTHSSSVTAHPNLPAEKKTKPANSEATNVWYFVLGSKTEDMPNIAEAPATSLKQPSPQEFAYIGCRLCL